MARGGLRVGAGRPPKSQSERWLAGDAGKRGQRPTAPAEKSNAGDVNLDPPGLLTTEEVAYWHLWAPLAAANGTLVDDTRPGMVLLCQVARKAAQLWGQIEAEGFTFKKIVSDPDGNGNTEPKAHPLLTHFRGLIQRQESLEARYRLAGTGKPIAAGDAKPKADPFQAFQKKGGIRRVK